jgi:hypothetical protein
MAMDNPIKLDHIFKRSRFKLMAVGASHSKLRSSINIHEARDVCVEWHVSIPLHSTPFWILNREQQLVEKQSITIFYAHLIQSESMQLIRIQAALLLFGNISLPVTYLR